MMGLAFFAPFLLAGSALIAVPWLLHHIRRPEREPVLFSSLLFVPNVKKEVIERRRIQHLLLMLLRILLFLILFFAFARPYWSSEVQKEFDDQSSIQVILLDTSYSMGFDNGFERAKLKAEKIIDSLSVHDYVFFISFDQQQLSFLDWELGQISPSHSQERAKEKLNNILISNKTTQLIPALQEAEKSLLTMIQGIEEDEPKLVIHMISDFQREGIPLDKVSWKLSSKIDLKTVYVHENSEQHDHFSILGSTVRNQIDTYRVVGKVKNWGGKDHEIGVDLWRNGELADRKEVFIKAGNASQVFFRIPKENEEIVRGWLEIGEDVLNIDNRHYFVMNPTQKHPIHILSSHTDQISSAAWFVKNALTYSDDIPWEVITVNINDVDWNAFNSESILVFCEWTDIDETFMASLMAKIKTGTNAIVMLDDTRSIDDLNSFLSNWNWKSSGLSTKDFDPRSFQLLSRMNFQHPMLELFQGQKFNDFSTIRFYRYQQLTPTNHNENQIIAHFESTNDGEKYPALLDIQDGDGRIILMPYSMQLDWTTFPKSKKFVPVLHEMLSYLQGSQAIQDSWVIGDRIQLPPSLSANKDTVVYQYDVGEEETNAAWSEQNNPMYNEPGLVYWKPDESVEKDSLLYAVNIQTDESNMEPIPQDEFLLRFCAAPSLDQDSLVEEERLLTNEDVVQRNEYGIFMMIAFFGFVMFEMWYASKLT